MLKTILVAVAATLLTASVSAEYKSKSKFSASYKCVSDEKGGFNHRANGHDLVRFKGEEEFFLTHISNMPLAPIKQSLKLKLSFHPEIEIATEEDKVREQFEQIAMSQLSSTGAWEEGSYYFRNISSDPNTIVSWHSCSATKWSDNWSDDGGGIDCHSDAKHFLFNPGTGRFTYAYLGSWHEKVKNDYYGDSSIFAFGTCKEYYP